MDPRILSAGAQPGRPRVATHFQRPGYVSLSDACMADLAICRTILQNSYPQLGQVHFEFVTAAAATAGCMSTCCRPGLTFWRCRGVGLLYSAVLFSMYLDGTACYSLWVLHLREQCGFNAHSHVTFLSPLSAWLSALQVHRERFRANAACPVISELLIA